MQENTHYLKKRIVGALIVGSVFGVGIFTFQYLSPLVADNKVKQYAAEVLTRCSAAKESAECYNKEIPKLMEHISMEEAFAVTRNVLKEDPRFGYCHTLGHALSAKEVAKNPDNWKEVIARCPTDICNYGCLHGPLLERYSKYELSGDELESLKSELKEVCEPRRGWRPTPWEESMCYHGLGHLAMYATAADVQKSIEICGATITGGINSHFSSCLEGVFMQIFQPLEPEDVELVKAIVPSKENAALFCGRYEDTVRNNCWRESWPLFRKELMRPEGLISFCGYPKTPEGKKSCRAVVVILVTTIWAADQNQPEKVNAYCDALPENLKNECYSVAVMRLIQMDPQYLSKAISICKLSKNNAGDESCFQELAGIAANRFHHGSSELSQYCAALPKPWDTYCTTINSKQ